MWPAISHTSRLEIPLTWYGTYGAGLVIVALVVVRLFVIVVPVLHGESCLQCCDSH